MSHMRTCSVSILNANESILLQAMSLLAKEYGKTVVKSVRAMNGETTDVLAGIEGMNGSYAYGVRVEGGKVQVYGDDWNAATNLQTFQKRVTQAYNVMAFQTSAVRQGLRVQVQKAGNKYVLVGSKAA